MQIREAKIFSFGKLQKQDFHFEPGINVVYGSNETGKTTLHEFLVAMLFGLEKNRGRTKGTDGYLRYEPWHAPAYYSGAMRFEVEGRPFYLERNFYHREKREVLRNEADGEELSVAYGDLAVLLGGISKETFGNTYDISQSGAVTGRELSDVLSEYLSDASESGNGSIHVARAQDLLERKKKELNAKLNEQREQRAKERRALILEQDLLEQDCARLKSTLAEERQMQKKTVWDRNCADVLKEKGVSGERVDVPEEDGTYGGHTDMPQENVGRRYRKPAFAWIIALFIGMLGNLFCYLKLSYPTTIFEITELALGIVAVALLFFGLHRKNADANPVEGQEERNRELSDEARAQVETARQQSERLFGQLEDAMAEKETRLYNIRESLESLEQPGVHEQELQTELDAILLAKEEIGNLAREFGEERKDEIGSEVSRYVSALTGGKYDSVCVDENGELRVLTDGKEVPPEALSRGTLEQFYLAFRLAVGNIVTREEPMPLLLDEAFAMYDDMRLMQTLRVLKGLDRQVILFTCQHREMNFLEEMGIRYHRIEMEP